MSAPRPAPASLRYSFLAIKLMLIIALMASLFVAFSSCQKEKPDLARFAKGSLKKLRILDPPPARPARVFFDAKGKEVRLADFKGKTVLLNIWASWCAPCVAELPSLDQLQEEFQDQDLVVIAISMDQSQSDARDFFTKTSIKHLALYHDPSFGFASDLGVSGLPISVLFSKSGRELARIAGEVDWTSTEAKALIRAGIGDPSP